MSRRATSAQAGDLVDANHRRWLGDVVDAIERPVFVRGFLEGVYLSPVRPIDPVVELLAAHRVRTLHIEDRFDIDEPDEETRKGLERWADCPAFACFETIDASEEIIGGMGWQILLSSPHLTNVREVILSDEDATAETAAAIADAPNLRLEILKVMGWMAASLGDAGAERLADAAHLACLRKLTLWNCGIREAGARALANSPHIRALETLDLGCGNYSLNKIGPDGAKALADSTNFQRLTSLDVGFNEIGDDGGVALVESTGFPVLESLLLQANDLTNVTVRAFQSSHERFPMLRGVDLSHNTIYGGGIWSFVRAPVFQQLEFLWLYHNQVGDEGVEELIWGLANRPSKLHELNLTNNPITAEGIGLILAATEFDQIEKLFLGLLSLDDAQKQELRDRFGERLIAI